MYMYLHICVWVHICIRLTLSRVGSEGPKIAYLCRSFFAKEPCNKWIIFKKRHVANG